MVRVLMWSFHTELPAFASGKDNPRDFLESCIACIQAHEPDVGAFVHMNLDAAREAAAQSAARWKEGKPLSKIDGMPVGIKDIAETVDMPTQMGSPLYKGWQSGRDAATVTALREAGAVIVGKTVTTEFAATYPGGTRNPWDKTRTPGGSSSGSAAAVAAGMLPAALGTQVVGSIVRPASFCGCVGFKPSVGAINRGGSHDAFSQSCDGAADELFNHHTEDGATRGDVRLSTIRSASGRSRPDCGRPLGLRERAADGARQPFIARAA